MSQTFLNVREQTYLPFDNLKETCLNIHPIIILPAEYLKGLLKHISRAQWSSSALHRATVSPCLNLSLKTILLFSLEKMPRFPSSHIFLHLCYKYWSPFFSPVWVTLDNTSSKWLNGKIWNQKAVCQSGHLLLYMQVCVYLWGDWQIL